MKKNKIIALLVTLVSSSLVAVMAASIAWFSSKVSVTTEDNLTGSSDGAYFAYGDGTHYDNPDTLIKEGPYGIETPRQLYNLAWLQYLGYFNTPKNGVITPVYFELNADIDMTGWILPPIGTTLYPFIGEFNGNGHTITNLTVSNDFNEIKATNKMPSAIRRAESLSNVNIVGMFGVIGELDNNITATYDSSVTSVSDFTIAGATIKNSLSETLAGIAAGYVNGPLKNVAITSRAGDTSIGEDAVMASRITTAGAANFDDYTVTENNATVAKFKNISEYGVVGYCEEEYLGEVTNTVSETYNATANTYEYIAQDEGDQSGWGGSIDMETTYNGLLDAWSTFNTNTAYSESTGTGVYQYAQNKTSTEDINTGDITNSYSNYTNYTFSTNYNYYGYRQKDTDNKVTSQYTFAHRNNTDRYMYLYGENDVVLSNVTSVNSTRYNVQDNCFYITKTVGTDVHHLTRNGTTGVTDATTDAGGTVWKLDGNNRIYTVVDGTTYYYLRYNNGNLEVTTTAGNGTAWTFDGNYITYTYNNNIYYIRYDNGWKLSSVSVDNTYYTFSVGNNYLSYNGTGNSVSNNGTVQNWYMDNNGYYPEGYTTRHLLYRNSTVECRTDTNRAYFTWDGTYLSTSSGTKYYVQCNNGTWSAPSSAPSAANRPVRTEHKKVDISNYTIDRPAATGFKVRVTDNTQTEDYTIHTQSTFFPLRQKYTETTSTNVQGYKFYFTSNNTRYYLLFDTSLTNNLGTTTDEEAATIWTTTSYVRPLEDQTYYLNNANGIGCTTSTTNRFSYSNSRLSYSTGIWNTTTYYLTYSNGSLTTTTTRTNVSNVTIYEKEKHMNGIPEDTNTGYIIGGKAADAVGSIRVSQYYGPGDSSNNNLNGATYSNSRVTLSTVYTIKSDNLSSTTISESYSDTYKASKKKLEDVLSKNPSRIYGLHFTAADIEYGKTYASDGVTVLSDSSAYAEKAVINGDTYPNYELPTNCIDFSLKEKGYINFIAGAYYSGNNTFFTIQEVQRDSNNKISNIRNIAAVYGSTNEGNSYIYEYTTYDNNTANKHYSVPFKFDNGQKVQLDGSTYTPYSSSASLPSGYTKLFNCRWIDSKASLQTTSGSYKGYPYYFEIPMNDGEYCMGSPSFSGASGAYLMYLDIGANAKKVYRTEMIEYYKWIDEIYSYPKGVFVMAAGTTNATDQNSYCVRLGDSYTGTLIMDRTGNAENDEAKYTGTGDATKESVSYKFPILTLKDENNHVVTMDEIAYKSATTTEVKRLTFYDFNMNDSSLRKIVVTDTYVGGVKQGRDIEKYSNFDISTQTGTEDDELVIYTVSGTTVTKVTNTDSITFSTTSNTTKLITFSVSYADGSTITIKFTCNVKATTVDGHNEYTPNGYAYTVTLIRPDGSTIELNAYVVVTSYRNSDGTYTYTFSINDNPITGTTTTPIVVTLPAIQQQQSGE